MIQINLLPDELRHAGRTRPATLGLLFGATVVAFGGLAAVSLLWFNLHADRQARVDIAQEQLDSLVPRAQYADTLGREKGEFEKRNSTIGEIAKSRVAWARRLDRLGEIVNLDASQSRHKVWLESIDVDSRADASNPGVKLAGFSAGDDIDAVSNFHEDVTKDPVFAQGFKSSGLPSSSLEEPDEELVPVAKRGFSFEMKLPPKEKAKPAPKKPAEKPAAQ